MNSQEPLIDAYTRRFLRNILNFMMRASAVALAWIGLVAIAGVLNFALGQMLGWIGASESELTVARTLSIGYAIAIAFCITINGIVDAMRLVYANFKEPHGEPAVKSEGGRNADQE